MYDFIMITKLLIGWAKKKFFRRIKQKKKKEKNIYIVSINQIMPFIIDLLYFQVPVPAGSSGRIFVCVLVGSGPCRNFILWFQCIPIKFLNGSV